MALSITDSDLTGVENKLSFFLSSGSPGEAGEVITNDSSDITIVMAWGTLYQVPPGCSVGGLNTIDKGVDFYKPGSLI